MHNQLEQKIVIDGKHLIEHDWLQERKLCHRRDHQLLAVSGAIDRLQVTQI